jgi:exodeoxyribonuclease-3
MKLATWNVNSIRSRLERLIAWLAKQQPDVLCLQELKGTDDAFPYEAVQEAGYAATVHGQKTYNGVAILSRSEPTVTVVGMDDGVDDPQARLIAAEIDGVWFASAYVPNGSEVGSDKYAYKLDWLARLRAHLERHWTPEAPLALCGDFNVAIDNLDIARPDEWENTVLTADGVRDALAHVRDWGFVDVFRNHNPKGGVYSWWDYRQLAFPKGNGLRIDHIYTTAPLAERSVSASIDRDERKGSKPSDHAPVLAEFA